MALRKLNNWRQLAAIFQILGKVWFCVEQLPQTLKRELLPTVMTEGLILESRCVRLWSLFKDVLPVNETLLKGSWQLSSPAGSLNLNEIPCRKGKRVSVEIIRIGTLYQSCWSWKIFVFTPWFCVVSDSLRNGPWQKEKQGAKVSNKQDLDSINIKKVEILWWGGGCALRGLVSLNRSHAWILQWKIFNHLSVK